MEAVLSNFGVKRIVIGHTPTAGTVIPRFGGRVLIIDVGLSAAYGRRLACLMVEGGKFYCLHRGEKLAIPDGLGFWLARLLEKGRVARSATFPSAFLDHKLGKSSATRGQQ